jgi:hypothetical protein
MARQHYQTHRIEKRDVTSIDHYVEQRGNYIGKEALQV